MKALSKSEYSPDSSEVSVISSSQWKNVNFSGIFNAVKNTDFMRRIYFLSEYHADCIFLASDKVG